MRKFHGHQRGFTLIELLVVVAIVGILSAMAAVNYLVALDKAKQKKTLSDIRSIAAAWESRSSDRGAYTAAGQNVFDWPDQELTQTDLETMLSPTYIRPMARVDGWGFPLAYAVKPNPTGQGASEYAIRSCGKDGQCESEYTVRETTRFDCDMVFSNGQFVVMPKVR